MKRIIIGISGASGVIYGVRALEILREAGIESHLVMSRSAEVTLAHETNLKVAEVRKLARTAYNNTDMAAAIASVLDSGFVGGSAVGVSGAGNATRFGSLPSNSSSCCVNASRCRAASGSTGMTLRA